MRDQDVLAQGSQRVEVDEWSPTRTRAVCGGIAVVEDSTAGVEAAKRAGLTSEEVGWIEDGRLYMLQTRAAKRPRPPLRRR
mgnify:CR=1 FL=1